MNEYLAQIINMSHINRYSTIPVIRRESIAEHSFFVSAIIIKLWEEYNFNLGIALAMATIHDMTESYTDDITVMTKRKFPKIAKAVEEAEYEIAIEIFGTDMHELWCDYKMLGSREAKFVKLADTIQVLQYADNEIKLGNDGYMMAVRNDAQKRLSNLEEVLDEFKR